MYTFLIYLCMHLQYASRLTYDLHTPACLPPCMNRTCMQRRERLVDRRTVSGETYSYTQTHTHTHMYRCTQKHACAHMSVCRSVRGYVLDHRTCEHKCMPVCMYVCLHASMQACRDVHRYACMYVLCIAACMNESMFECVHS